MGQSKRKPQPYREHEYREYRLLVPKEGAEYIKRVSHALSITEEQFIRLALAQALQRAQGDNSNA